MKPFEGQNESIDIKTESHNGTQEVILGTAEELKNQTMHVCNAQDLATVLAMTQEEDGWKIAQTIEQFPKEWHEQIALALVDANHTASLVEFFDRFAVENADTIVKKIASSEEKESLVWNYANFRNRLSSDREAFLIYCKTVLPEYWSMTNVPNAYIQFILNFKELCTRISPDEDLACAIEEEAGSYILQSYEFVLLYGEYKADTQFLKKFAAFLIRENIHKSATTFFKDFDQDTRQALWTIINWREKEEIMQDLQLYELPMLQNDLKEYNIEGMELLMGNTEYFADFIRSYPENVKKYLSTLLPDLFINTLFSEIDYFFPLYNFDEFLPLLQTWHLSHVKSFIHNYPDALSVLDQLRIVDSLLENKRRKDALTLLRYLIIEGGDDPQSSQCSEQNLPLRARLDVLLATESVGDVPNNSKEESNYYDDLETFINYINTLVREGFTEAASEVFICELSNGSSFLYEQHSSYFETSQWFIDMFKSLGLEEKHFGKIMPFIWHQQGAFREYLDANPAWVMQYVAEFDQFDSDQVLLKRISSKPPYWLIPKCSLDAIISYACSPINSLEPKVFITIAETLLKANRQKDARVFLKTYLNQLEEISTTWNDSEMRDLEQLYQMISE